VIFVFTWFSRVLTSHVLTSRASTCPLFTSALGTYLRPDHVRTAARLENWCPRCYYHIKHPYYYFSIVVQPRAAIVVSFLCHTCTFCMWGIPYLWIARSLPIPPFPARFTVFRILSCFSHSYLLHLASVWYLHVPVLHMFYTELSWPYCLAPDTLQHLPRFKIPRVSCIWHIVPDS
jgi:hypothetical protein